MNSLGMTSFGKKDFQEVLNEYLFSDTDCEQDSVIVDMKWFGEHLADIQHYGGRHIMQVLFFTEEQVENNGYSTNDGIISLNNSFFTQPYKALIDVNLEFKDDLQVVMYVKECNYDKIEWQHVIDGANGETLS